MNKAYFRIVGMEVYKHGTKVKTVVGNIEGILTGVSIRGTRITYEISYFNKGEHKSCWLDELEFVTETSEKERVGFK